MLLRVGPLPDNPLAAAAAFHAEVLPRVLALLDAPPAGEGDHPQGGGGGVHLTLVFAAAGYPHRAWREAAIQTIARECAPARINAVASAEEPAIAAAAAYIAAAPGLTGQYFPLDSQGAGAVINSTR